MSFAFTVVKSNTGKRKVKRHGAPSYKRIHQQCNGSVMKLRWKIVSDQYELWEMAINPLCALCSVIAINDHQLKVIYLEYETLSEVPIDDERPILFGDKLIGRYGEAVFCDD